MNYRTRHQAENTARHESSENNRPVNKFNNKHDFRQHNYVLFEKATKKIPVLTKVALIIQFMKHNGIACLKKLSPAHKNQFASTKGLERESYSL